jgi:diguanylate cyclase (GGDEF)-like protein/PAS domain S-box-containing protein
MSDSENSKATVEDSMANHKSVGQSSRKITPPRNGFIDRELKIITLKESEARYRRLFETAKDGILILDGDTGRIADANPYLQDMLGYSKDELIGKALWEIGPVQNIPDSQAAMRKLQSNEYIRYEDIPLETKSGELKHVEFISNVYLVDGWRVIQCNIRDITERRSAEKRAKVVTGELMLLVDELQWRDKEMQLLNRMNDLLQSCMTQTEAYKVITLIAEELFPGQNGCLAILPAKDQPLQVVSLWGSDEIMKPSFSLEDCWALRRGQLHEVADPATGLVCGHFFHPPRTGYLCLPLMVQGETLGVLTLLNDSARKGEHTLSLQRLAVTVGEMIKLSLSNLKLREELLQQAVHDPLTGLYNRRYLDEVLPRELLLAQRRNTPLCVVIFDIDKFKQFNDTFGHAPGDLLLREFGRILRERLRKSDISCRFGGDEFVLVLPDSSIADTQERVEQIRRILKELQLTHVDGQPLGTITLSAGIASMPEQGVTETELLRAADEAMYRAKQAGGDRITVCQSASSL